MPTTPLRELFLQSLEHEKGGVLIYRTALECVENDDLRQEWETYADQTQEHVDRLTSLCVTLGIDPTEVTPGCRIVQHVGHSLVVAMKMALAEGDMAAAELVACECVVLAETKDHADWELIGRSVELLNGEEAAAVKAAYEQIEDEEDEHLYHTKGWCRELHLKALDLTAMLPPPEERRNVKSAVGAAKVVKELKPAAH